jgi:hypothetical protein
VAYVTELRPFTSVKRHSSSGDYLGLYLVDDVTEIGVDGDSYVRLSLEEDQVDDRHIQYIRGRVVPENEGRYDYKIRVFDDRTSPYGVRVPVEWKESKEDNPFYGAEHGQEVLVEINSEDGEFRVYRPEDYSYRQQQVLPEIRAPLVVPLLRPSGEIDVTWDREEPGQQIRFVPFERHQFRRDLEKYVEEHDVDVEFSLSHADAPLMVGNDLFQQVKQEYGLDEPTDINQVELYGLPAADVPSDGVPSGDDPPWQRLYRTATRDSVTAIVPREGVYKAKFIWTTPVENLDHTTTSRSVAVAHRDVAEELGYPDEHGPDLLGFAEWATDEWLAPFYDVDEDLLTVYCPVSIST